MGEPCIVKDEWLGELEHLSQLTLMSVSEVRAIQKERRECFQRINKVPPSRDDFIRFIDYEMELLVKIEQKRLAKMTMCKKDETDYKIMDRIRRLLLLVIRLSPEDLNLWKEYFRFCKRFKFWLCGSRELQGFLDMHGSREEVWKYAADFEVDSKNWDKARSWLVAGTQKHPRSKELHTALITLELDMAKIALEARAQRLRVKDETSREKLKKQVLRGKCAEIAYCSAARIITDLDFFTNIYELTGNYPAASNLREKVLQDIIINFPSSEMAWNMRARLPLEGGGPGAPTEIDLEANIEIKKKTKKERILECVGMYEEALRTLPSMAMWSLYLDFLVEINTAEENPKAAANVRKVCWKNGMEAALEAGMVSEKHYTFYIDHLERLGGKAKRRHTLLERGTSQYPLSFRLWYGLVQWYLTRELEAEGMTTFRNANSRLMQHSVDDVKRLWDLALLYMMTTTVEKTEELFLEGIRLRTDLGQYLKPRYLTWKFQTHGIGEARKLLENNLITHPPCLQFYQLFTKYEALMPEPCLKSVRNLYETLVRHFGTDEPYVWVDYLNFELRMGDVTFVPRVHQRAQAALTNEKLEVFLSRYSLQDIQSLTHPDIIE